MARAKTVRSTVTPPIPVGHHCLETTVAQGRGG